MSKRQLFISFIIGLIALADLTSHSSQAALLSLCVVLYFAWQERHLLGEVWSGVMFPTKDLRWVRAGVIAAVGIIPLLLLPGSIVTWVLAIAIAVSFTVAYKRIIAYLIEQAEAARRYQPFTGVALRPSAPAEMENSEQVFRHLIADLARLSNVPPENRQAGEGAVIFRVTGRKIAGDLTGDVLLTPYIQVDRRTANSQQVERAIRGRYGPETSIIPVPEDEYLPAKWIAQAQAAEGVRPRGPVRHQPRAERHPQGQARNPVRDKPRPQHS